MGDLIKFFKSKNLDRKFAKLGEGHRLNDGNICQNSTSNSKKKSEPTASPGSSSKAAEAAMSRLTISRPPTAGNRTVSVEVCTQSGGNSRNQSVGVGHEQQTVQQADAEKPAVIPRLLFWCPNLFGDTVMGSRDEVEQAIQNYLLSESNCNTNEAVVLMLIRGLEKSKVPPSHSTTTSLSEIKENRKQNIIRILQNLINTPENPLYRRLRASNRLIQDLLSIDGMEPFLTACKFTKQLLPVSRPDKSNADSAEQPNEEVVENEIFYVISEEDAKNQEYLERLLNLFITADPILPELYRDTKVYRATGRALSCISREHLPDEFFLATKEDLRRAIDQQQQIIEESGMLLTKAMRERLKTQGLKLFRYTIIRVRLPDNLILQGTFYAVDKLLTVRQWISECFSEPCSFRLYTPPSLQLAARLKVPPTTQVELTDDDAGLSEMGLAPSSLINLIFEEDHQQRKTSTRLRADLSRSIETI
ncbi:unnamed protein product [Trichobilharzia szidati]|nr:unnamed protein product [Trichobilharzia szidati]